MKVLFTANMPAPYRVDFFNELGKLCDLTVVFERESSIVRDKMWRATGAEYYHEAYLEGIKTGEAEAVSLGLIQYVRDRSFDRIIIGMYSSPSSMIGIEYMRIHRIPFYLSTDGGFVKNESCLMRAIKTHFISAASGWFSPSDKATEYLVHYGADKDRIWKYPFTSISKKDLDEAQHFSVADKGLLRTELGVTEEYVLLSVGRFSYEGGYGKGYDTLLQVAEKLSPSFGIYIVGDEPTEEFVRLKNTRHLEHVHFVGFQVKENLKKYYAMADAFILLTRGDVWGLVINEAMSFSLPVITTEQCLAGTELVKNGENGFLVEAGDVAGTAESINKVFSSPRARKEMGNASRKKIEAYSVENMAFSHFTKLTCS